VNDLKKWNAGDRIGDISNILNAEKKYEDENQGRLLSETIKAGFWTTNPMTTEPTIAFGASFEASFISSHMCAANYSIIL